MIASEIRFCVFVPLFQFLIGKLQMKTIEKKMEAMY